MLGLDLVVRRLSDGAALLGLPVPRIAAGAPADFCLVDLRASWQVGEAGYESRAENCCFAGRTLRGRVLTTVAGGSVAYRERAFALSAASSAAYVLLQDGTRFDGEACGASGHAVGEVVFTTGMSGYQECMSDPSFHAQLITFTAPMVGNYGVSSDAMESGTRPRPGGDHARGRRCLGCPQRAERLAGLAGGRAVVGITGVDTRALVRHIRDEGAMLGGVFGGATGEDEARALIAAEPPMAGRDLAREVTPRRRATDRRRLRPVRRRPRHGDQDVDRAQLRPRGG